MFVLPRKCRHLATLMGGTGPWHVTQPRGFRFKRAVGRQAPNKGGRRLDVFRLSEYASTLGPRFFGACGTICRRTSNDLSCPWQGVATQGLRPTRLGDGGSGVRYDDAQAVATQGLSPTRLGEDETKAA